MQSELTAVLDTIACQTKAVEIDKDLLQKQLEEAVLAKHQAISVLQNVLVIVGVSMCSVVNVALNLILFYRFFDYVEKWLVTLTFSLPTLLVFEKEFLLCTL